MQSNMKYLEQKRTALDRILLLIHTRRECSLGRQEPTERGIRVSRIDAGGAAEGGGVRQEDRLVVVG